MNQDIFLFALYPQKSSLLVFTWIWAYTVGVTRHRKAIQTTQILSTREIVLRKKILRSTVTALAVACDVTLSTYPHRASLKNMPDHGNITSIIFT
jgi:hypothetical protein